jgi:hypothetical protein
MLPPALRKPQILLPAAIVVGMVAVAFGLQPGGGKSEAATTLPEITSEPTATQSPTATPTSSPTARPSTTAGASSSPGSSATSDVAGARATGTASPTTEADFSRDATQCGSIQEQSQELSVQQALQKVSVTATHAAVYPIDYFRCILLATGGRDAVSLATSIQKAEREGATNVVLVDLWITNGGKDFGQVNLRTATVSAAGQTFSPLATLSGRSEVVVSSGQGRAVTIVVVLENSIGASPGPMTLTIDAPLVGGKPTAGKYQLFLPTP